MLILFILMNKIGYRIVELFLTFLDSILGGLLFLNEFLKY